jgi:hypothetical protein
MRGWQRGFYVVLGLVLGGIGLFGASVVIKNGGESPALVGCFILVPAGLGVYMIALALRSRLAIEGSHLSVRGVFREQNAELDEIEGYRAITTRNGSFWRLELRQGRGSITIQKWFDCDELRAWFQQLADLDERDSKALLEEIQQNQNLGASPEERLRALARAKTMNIALSVALIAAAIGCIVAHSSVRLLLAAVLAAGPFVVLYLLKSEPLLYALGKPRKDPRTDTVIAVVASAMGLLFTGLAANFVSLAPLLVWMAAVLAVFAGAFLSMAQQGPRPQGMILLVLIFGGMYAYGLAASADTQLDKSKPTRYETQITGKHLAKGKSTNYYLDLAPWGPENISKPLNVSGSAYEGAEPGDPVCLALHPGALHAAWYERVACGTELDSPL